MKKILTILMMFSLIWTVSACEDVQQTNQAEQLVKLIDIGFAEGDDTNAVTKNLTFNTFLGGFSDVTISWLSLNQDVISHEGVVTRKDIDTVVTVLVRLTIGELKAQKNFQVTVLGTSIEATVTTLVLDETLLINLTSETELKALETPKVNGYKFLYWESLDGQKIEDTFVIREDVTIRAVLEEAVTYTYRMNIYTQVFNTDTYTLLESKTLSEPKDTMIAYNTELSGYIFNAELSDPFVKLTREDLVFNVYYDVKTVDVTYYYKGNVIEIKTFMFESTLTYPNTESDVIGWSLQPQGESIEDPIVLVSDLNVYALIEEKDVTYEGYYDVLEGVSNSNLRAVLNTLISNYTFRSYDRARDVLQDSDEDPNNPNNIILVYNRASVLSRWDSGNTWNREHVWPQSYLLDAEQKADMHNLKPANPSVNSTRSNLRFVSGSGTHGIVGGGFFPGEEDKGDIARIVMFMHIRYNLNVSLVGDLNILLRWHDQDPVDAFESRRNDVIYNDTKNRNPFIDYPDLANRLFGFPSFYQAYESSLYDVYYQLSQELFVEKQKTPF
jgi:endonuclease I